MVTPVCRSSECRPC